MAWLRASLWVQLFLALYFQATLWFPLGSWNDTPGERLIETIRSGAATRADLLFSLAMFLPLGLFFLGYWKRLLALLWLCLAGYVGWAVVQIDSWWVPYFFGADENDLRNHKLLERTYKILPSYPNRPAPDAMHLVLDVLLLGAVLLAFAGLLIARHERAAPPPPSARATRAASGGDPEM
jgi:hypothetical protein